jgi:ABC-2 type transport system ATP-binding protein
VNKRLEVANIRLYSKGMLIEARTLTKTFDGVTAVDRVSFAVGAGEVLGFLGPNGAGKTTTMRMLAGFLPPTSGAARIAGFDLATEPLKAKQQLGYLPEGAPLYGDMTCRSFLDFIAATRGLGGYRKARRLDWVLHRLGLEPVLHARIDTLSKGFKRRVGIAQAILADPPALILDEPTDGLDPNQKHEMRDLIREMAPEKAILISTHLLEELEAVCTRVLVIDRGLICADTTPANLAAQGPLDEVFRELTSGTLA